MSRKFKKNKPKASVKKFAGRLRRSRRKDEPMGRPMRRGDSKDEEGVNDQQQSDNRTPRPQSQQFRSFRSKRELPDYRAVNKKLPKKKNDGIRLNKFIAHAGICARRKADEHIKAGLVTVNGRVVKEMGYKVQRKDVVRFEGVVVKPQRKVYVLMNKPKNMLTTTNDPQGRRTVMDIVSGAADERLYPVGRLDRNTTGLLLLTNDGDLAQSLSHPSKEVRKLYHVHLDKPLTKNDLRRIAEGKVVLEEGKVLVDNISYVSGSSKNEVGIQIHIGWNRVVRRTFEALGYKVVKLDRVIYAGLTKKDLPRGKWRYLEPKELLLLRHFKG